MEGQRRLWEYLIASLAVIQNCLVLFSWVYGGRLENARQ